MAPMKLYMTPGSCSTGIHILLEELEAAFEVYVVNLPAGDHFRADYVALNPKSTIPALVRGDGRVLTEVAAIAFWIARAHPRAGFWPADIETETRAMELIAYTTATIHGQGFARIFATGSFSRDPAAHEEIRRLGREIVEKGFAIVNDTIAADAYALGAYSAVDPILFYVEFWADKTGIALPPALAAHYRRMLTRPAVQRVLREEGYNPATLGLLLP